MISLKQKKYMKDELRRKRSVNDVRLYYILAMLRLKQLGCIQSSKPYSESD